MSVYNISSKLRSADSDGSKGLPTSWGGSYRWISLIWDLMFATKKGSN
jgi:hypothetical protein